TYTDEPCSCGRAYRRLRYAGRKDDMRTVGGINIFPSNIEAIVRRSADLGGEFRLATPHRNDFLRARVEAAGNVAAPAFARIGAQLHDALRLALGINVRVEVLPFGRLDRFEGKARRWEEF
ncbi:MAG: phenylacetate--CoA ligase, partial [Candidatus Binataceae bacterium]